MPEFGRSEEMDRRKAQTREFFGVVIEPGRFILFVSDESTLRELVDEDAEDVLVKCQDHYGVTLEPRHFSIPLYQLLDELEVRRHGNPGTSNQSSKP